MLLTTPLCERQILIGSLLCVAKTGVLWSKEKHLEEQELVLQEEQIILEMPLHFIQSMGMLPSWEEGGMNWVRSLDISPC